MKTIPYLSFAGDCAEAFRHYAALLGGRVTGMITHGESPIADQVPADWHPRIMNAHLVAGEVELMGGDSPPGSGAPAGFSLSLHLDSAEEAERIFTGLAEGGTVAMPLGPTFWAEKFGMLTDRYGTPWMVNYEGSVVYRAPEAAAAAEGGTP